MLSALQMVMLRILVTGIFFSLYNLKTFKLPPLCGER